MAIRTNSIFQNQEVILVSMHGKEAVLGPALYEAFGIHLAVASELNTDDFGTFSGEKSRPDTQYKTALMKLAAGFKSYPKYSWGLASEGAFVPHPEVPFLTVNYELLVLVNRLTGLEISSHYRTTETNFDSITTGSWEEINLFASQTGFPEHALIIRPNLLQPGNAPFYLKGINSYQALKEGVEKCREISADGQVFLETDMRAMYNPTRMQSIKYAALELVNNMKSFCSVCAAPGFARSQSLTGLPCEMCNQPTPQVLAHVYSCGACLHTEQKQFPYGTAYASAGTCPFCNP